MGWPFAESTLSSESSDDALSHGRRQNFLDDAGSVIARVRVASPRTTLEVSMDVISHFAARYERSKVEELTLEEYLDECKRNPLAYATAAERML